MFLRDIIQRAENRSQMTRYRTYLRDQLETERAEASGPTLRSLQADYAQTGETHQPTYVQTPFRPVARRGGYNQQAAAHSRVTPYSRLAAATSTVGEPTARVTRAGPVLLLLPDNSLYNELVAFLMR